MTKAMVVSRIPHYSLPPMLPVVHTAAFGTCPAKPIPIAACAALGRIRIEVEVVIAV